MADTITIPTPCVPYGPEGVDSRLATASYIDSVLKKLAAVTDDGRLRVHIGGSNVTATVERILRDVAAALRSEVDPGSPVEQAWDEGAEFAVGYSVAPLDENPYRSRSRS